MELCDFLSKCCNSPIYRVFTPSGIELWKCSRCEREVDEVIIKKLKKRKL